MDVRGDAVAAAFEATRAAFDEVAKAAGPEGYLVGAAFSIADLTAAALLAPAADPPDSDMTLPEPMPEAVLEWKARWEGLPGALWVREIYRRHRPTPDRSAQLR